MPTQAWDAVYAKAESKHFGTSTQDVDDYASAGGAVAAAAACAAAGAPEASPLCAVVGGAVASAVADAIQSVGSALFGHDDFNPQPNDVWNPRADAAIAGIVRALRLRRGLTATNPPGGSARNWPEWDEVAPLWAKNVNDFVAGAGGPIVWFYESGNRAHVGRVRQAAIDAWLACGAGKAPDAKCRTPAGKSASAPLPAAVVNGTQKTAMAILHVDAQGRPVPAGGGLLPWLLGGGILAGVLWKLRKRGK